MPLTTLGGREAQKLICSWGGGGGSGWEKKKICFVWVLVSSSKFSRVVSCLLKLHYHVLLYHHTKETALLTKDKWARKPLVTTPGHRWSRWEKVLKYNGGESSPGVRRTRSHRCPWSDLRRHSSASRRTQLHVHHQVFHQEMCRTPKSPPHARKPPTARSPTSPSPGPCTTFSYSF